jgi:hypothetical protein
MTDISKTADGHNSLAYVYDGRTCLGFILARGKLGFEALDRDERSVGIYPTQRERHSRARCCRRTGVGAEMIRRAQPEAQLQRLLVEHLRWCTRGDVWWTHIPNGGWQSPIEAAIFKSLGVRAGSPDLLIIRAGQPLFLELKVPGRKLSPAQTEGHDALRRAGATVETAYNITRRSRSSHAWG